MGPISLQNLPRDVLLGVLDELRPLGPVTAPESTADKPMVSAGHLEYRANLLNLCLTSRMLCDLTVPRLYRDPLVRSRHELFRFFCTLAKQVDRRHMVRSFAWTGVLWDGRDGHTDGISSLRRGEDEAAFYAECWDLIKDQWPRDSGDMEIAKRAGICGPETMKDSKLLGSILAMCPRIKCLHMLSGAINDQSFDIRPSSQLETLLPFLQRYGCGSKGEIKGRAQHHGHLFLNELEVLAVECRRDVLGSSAILALLFTNLPLLQRVELRNPPTCTEILEIRKSETPLTAGVGEVTLIRAHHPQDDMASIVVLFPNLVSLHAEFLHGSYHSQLDSDLGPDLAEALLKVSGTLERLSLTISPETYPREGRWDRYESHLSPPSLSTLNEMTKLKDLTTESIWLFGTENPAVALRLSHLLPRSLVRLHLIDYWGTPDPAEFYPEFPNRCTPLEFYTHVFGILCGGAPVRLPELKEVTFTPKCLKSHSQSSLPNAGQSGENETKMTEDSMQSVTQSFERVGIRFRLILQRTNI